jgi:metal-sulfur cluster biosynthetic enzyme
MTESVDTARTVASAPASGAAPGAGEEVPDWLAEERAAAAEAGEPVETPSVSVSATPDAAFGADAPSAADAAVGADVAAADAEASDSIAGGAAAGSDSSSGGAAAGLDSSSGGAAAGLDSSSGGAAAGSGKPKASIADIEEAMKDVVDPELGINVVDLGLVYGTHVDDENVVTIDMTLTSAACPLTDVIEDQTRQALTTGPGGGLVQDFRINWVWLPPWGPDKITDDGRDQLRALGFNV